MISACTPQEREVGVSLWRIDIILPIQSQIFTRCTSYSSCSANILIQPVTLFILIYFYDTLSFSKILLWENLGGPERTEIFGVGRGGSLSFTTDASCQLNIFGHDGDLFCMDGTQVGVFKESHQVGF